jgi:hypothetical protein
MFIGHYSAALVAAAHPKAPKLGTLFVAAQLVDIGFFSFVLMGVEHMRIVPGMTATNAMDLYDMPFTHSLIGSLVWAAVFAGLLRFWLNNWSAALIGGVVVLSHWFLDVLVHGPDMTLTGAPPKFGLGLWNNPSIEMPLEIILTLGAAFLYLRATRSAAGKFKHSLWVLIGVMFAVQAWNWFGPQPTELTPSMPISALFAFVLFAGIAAWVAKSRMHIMH